LIEYLDGISRALGPRAVRRMRLTDVRILLAILDQPAIDPHYATAIELVRTLPSDYDSVAKVVRMMRDYKWIEDALDHRDQRRKFLIPTPKGYELRARLYAVPAPTAPQPPTENLNG
jgi:DNA-binding MarR family transcriptional regulator